MLLNSCTLKLFSIDGSSVSGLAILLFSCIIFIEINSVLIFFYMSYIIIALKDCVRIKRIMYLGQRGSM